MGFLSRLFVPRGVRRAMHPGRAVKRGDAEADQADAPRNAPDRQHDLQRRAVAEYEAEEAEARQGSGVSARNVHRQSSDPRGCSTVPENLLTSHSTGGRCVRAGARQLHDLDATGSRANRDGNGDGDAVWI